MPKKPNHFALVKISLTKVILANNDAGERKNILKKLLQPMNSCYSFVTSLQQTFNKLDQKNTMHSNSCIASSTIQRPWSAYINYVLLYTQQYKNQEVEGWVNDACKPYCGLFTSRFLLWDDYIKEHEWYNLFYSLLTYITSLLCLIFQT